MMRHEEQTLPGLEVPPVARSVDAPPLPSQPQWRRHSHAGGQWCDYCVLVEGGRPAGQTRQLMRRPTWHRTGVDGAQLLLCDGHAELLITGTRESRS